MKLEDCYERLERIRRDRYLTPAGKVRTLNVMVRQLCLEQLDNPSLSKEERDFAMRELSESQAKLRRLKALENRSSER